MSYRCLLAVVITLLASSLHAGFNGYATLNVPSGMTLTSSTDVDYIFDGTICPQCTYQMIGDHKILAQSGDQIAISQWGVQDTHYRAQLTGTGWAGMSFFAQNDGRIMLYGCNTCPAAVPGGPYQFASGGPWLSQSQTIAAPLPPDGSGGVIACDPGHPCDGSLNGAGSEEPLILDLNGDGIHTTRLETSPVLFDMNADGSPDLTGWTDAQTEEGLLFYDRDHDHVVDGNAELFGNRTPLPDGSIAATGVEALAAYDKRENGGNGDGVIGPGDVVWGILRIWVDRNHDGIATAAETYPLPELGIFAINLDFERLGADRSYGVDASGNFHVFQGSFRQQLRGRGVVVQRQIHDVFFRVRYQ